MLLRSLITHSFRNLADTEHRFHPHANLFVGDNGQGKTNLLEAIYFLSSTKSFRTTHVSSVIRFDARGVYVQGLVEKQGIERKISIGLESGPDERRRELHVNGEKVVLQVFLAQLHLFAYSSSRLEIVRGGPDSRRRFLDRGISTLDPGYLIRLNRYHRALKQRNSLLLRVGSRQAAAATLEPWDAEMAVAAQEIVESRTEYVDTLRDAFAAVTAAHAYHVDDLEILYRPSGFVPGAPEKGASELKALRRRELAAGHALIGPHRDELEIRLQGRPAAEVLSSGETKMAVLFLKLAKIALYRERWDDTPLFLLDDLDAELDPGIIQRLLRFLATQTQLFTTSPKDDVLRALQVASYRKFMLREGAVIRQENRGI